MRRISIICCFVFLGLATEAQTSHSVFYQPEANPEKPLTKASFSAAGLADEQLLVYLFRGDYRRISVDRDNHTFVAILNGYIDAYFHQCAANLPANKVEITTEQCATERVTTRDGIQGAPMCIDYVRHRTGIYAEPGMEAASREIEGVKKQYEIRDALRSLSKPDPYAGMLNVVQQDAATYKNMPKLIALNTCTSPGLKRFQENLRLFSMRRGLLTLPEDENTNVRQDVMRANRMFPYIQFAEALVSAESKNWSTDRLNTVTSVSIETRDAHGLPTQLRVVYQYTGSDRSVGDATAIGSLSFVDGVPKCLFLEQNPRVCNAPNANVIAEWKNKLLPDAAF